MSKGLSVTYTSLPSAIKHRSQIIGFSAGTVDHEGSISPGSADWIRGQHHPAAGTAPGRADGLEPAVGGEARPGDDIAEPVPADVELVVRGTL